MAPLNIIQGRGDWATDITVLSDRQTCVTSCRDGTLKIWDLAAAHGPGAIKPTSQMTLQLAFSSDAKSAYAVGEQGLIRKWSIPDYITLEVPADLACQVTSASVLQPAEKALVTTASGRVMMIALQTGEVTPIAAFDSVPDISGLMAVASSCGQVVVVTTHQTAPRAYRCPYWASTRLNRYEGGVLSAAVSDDGARFIAVCTDSKIQVWDTKTGDLLNVVALSQTSSGGIAIAKGGRTLAKASRSGDAWDCIVMATDLGDPRGSTVLEPSPAAVSMLTFNHDGHNLIAYCKDDCFRIWECSTGVLKVAFPGHSAYLSAFAIGETGNLAVSVAEDCTVKIWNLDLGEQVASLTCDQPQKRCAFLASERVVMVADGYGNVNFLSL